MTISSNPSPPPLSEILRVWDQPSIYFDVESDVKTDTTVDVGLYIPTAGKSWNHVVIINRGGGVADIYRNNEFVGRKKINDFPGPVVWFHREKQHRYLKCFY